MADEKKVAKKETKKATEKAEAPKKEEASKKAVKPAKKEVVKVNTSNKDMAKANRYDFSVIIAPIITEKSMAMIQNQNQATFKVKPSANKTQVKLAFERLFKVKATHVSVVTVRAKKTTRGGRYQGKIQGYKKAVITIAEGQAIDLFKE
ncbi:MAG: 50S ribosomal protein L23 [Bacilli bacterium]|nr:50S ribosomal protein L23 [Bacilli bacterium]